MATGNPALAKHIESEELVISGKKLLDMLHVINRRLHELKADKTFTSEDLQHYKDMLDQLESQWQDDKGVFAGVLLDVDMHAAEECRSTWAEAHELVEGMLQEVEGMPEEVKGVHGSLVLLKRRLSSMLHERHNLWDVVRVERELEVIDDKRLSHGGSFGERPMEPVPGDAACKELLNQCFDMVGNCLETAEDMPHNPSAGIKQNPGPTGEAKTEE